MMIQPTDGNRRFHRIDFDTTATVEDPDGRRYSCRVIDVSLQGALIEMPQSDALNVGDAVQLAMELDETRGISMAASVAHCEGQYAGCRCEAIDMDSLAHLKRLVELNLGDPELVDRELAALGSPRD